MGAERLMKLRQVGTSGLLEHDDICIRSGKKLRYVIHPVVPARQVEGHDPNEPGDPWRCGGRSLLQGAEQHCAIDHRKKGCGVNQDPAADDESNGKEQKTGRDEKGQAVIDEVEGKEPIGEQAQCREQSAAAKAQHDQDFERFGRAAAMSNAGARDREAILGHLGVSPRDMPARHSPWHS